MSGTNEREKVLLVDDSVETLEMVERHLSAAGYRVATCGSVEEAVRLLESEPVDLVLTDMRMPRISGLDLVRHVHENLRSAAVMMITGYATIEGAVAAIKLGADEYLAKPFTREELLGAVERSLSALRLRRAAHRLDEPEAPFGLIGESEAMRQVHAAIARAAAHEQPVLLEGEFGTGRAAAAYAIHHSGARASRPLAVLDFGYVWASPAFWSSHFQLADDGGVLLRRVERLDPKLYSPLLHALAPQPAGPGCETAGPTVKARILATCRANGNSSASEQFADAFRERLGGSRIVLPPLRERGDDILLLVRTMAARAARELGRPVIRFSDHALQVLRDYRWPGNVIELETMVYRLATHSSGTLIQAPDFPALMRFSAIHGPGRPQTLTEVELAHIQTVLAGVGGNKTKAAELLGIDRKTLREKLKAAAAPAARSEPDSPDGSRPPEFGDQPGQ